jgi:hypothetical protein
MKREKTNISDLRDADIVTKSYVEIINEYPVYVYFLLVTDNKYKIFPLMM